MPATSTYNFHGEERLAGGPYYAVKKMGTGCMMITRKGAQKIYDYCHTHDIAPAFNDPDTGKQCYAMFQPLIADTANGKDQYLGEDYSFCIRAEKVRNCPNFEYRHKNRTLWQLQLQRRLPSERALQKRHQKGNGTID